MAADLAVEKRQRPETQQRQVVRAYRAADDFGQEVINRAHADRREPQTQHVVPVPPIGGGLLHAGVYAGHFADQKQQRNPEQRRHRVPDADIQMLHLAVGQREQQRQNHQRKADEHENCDLPGNLKVFHAGRPAGGNRAYAAGNAGVDERAAHHDPDGAFQAGAQQTRQQPHDHAERGIGDPAVEHGCQMDGADAAERQPSVIR